jgi:hypothetical protein
MTRCAVCHGEADEVDNDLGPVCSECFKHCQWATLELLWQAAAVSPSRE